MGIIGIRSVPSVKILTLEYTIVLYVDYWNVG